MATRRIHHDHYVYVLFRHDGSPFYVGKGRLSRWIMHWKTAKPGASYKDNVIVGMQIAGVEMPRVKVAEGLSSKAASVIEIALIAAIGRYPAGPLTNLTDGGEGASGYIPRPESIAKRVAKVIGMKRSPEMRARNSQIHKGKTISAAQRALNSAAHRGRRLSQEQIAERCARHHSDETRAKMRAVQRARAEANRLRPDFRVKSISPEQRAKMCARRRESIALNGLKPLSTESLRKIAESNRGQRRSPEQRARMADAARRAHARRRQDTRQSTLQLE